MRIKKKLSMGLLSVVLGLMLVGSGIFSNFSSAEGSKKDNEELLDVGFGGSFSSEKAYTNAAGEKMDGEVTRRTGEETIKDSSVQLNGNENGVDFNPRTSLGNEELDKSFAVETQFKPEDKPSHYNTLVSVGGDLYVRYTSDNTIEYGFDVNNNGQWSSAKETVKAPKVGEDSTMAIAYEPDDSGAKMRVFMNGEELPSVSTDKGRPSSSIDKIGFGNEVHASGQDRGFKGSLSRAVVTQFDGSFDISFLKTMNAGNAEKHLLMYGLGDIEETQYSISEDELSEGDIEVQGGEIADLGTINMSGDASNINFKPKDSITDNNDLAGNYIGEILVDPSALKSETVLMDLAGAVTVRVSGDDALDILVNGNSKETIDISDKLNNDKEDVHISMLYQNIDDEETTVSLWVDNEQIGDPVTLTEHPDAQRNSVMFAGTDNNDLGDSLTGNIFGVSFASIEGEFSESMLSLSGGPCTVPDDLEPGHQIKISPNECPAALTEKASQVRPKPKQVTWQQYEQTAFIHYGINTYNEVEWGGFDLDPDDFQPTDLDTDQWAKTLKESGFEMAMLTVKHHDGFLLYPSRYTDFSVASSSWQNGNGDVLREFVDSMRKYDLDVGLYLSPADHQAYSDEIYANGSERSEREIPTLVDGDERKNDPDFPNFKLQGTDYGELFMNQLYEILTDYGEIDEVWFDGAQGRIPGDAEEKYDWDSYYELINKLQPQAVIANTGDDVRWVGNESGFARDNEWSVVGAGKSDDGSQYSYPSAQSKDLGSRSALSDAAANGADYLTWWPAEVDVSIRDGWFFHDNQQPKSVDQLRNIYYDSVARNSVLLLNVPPNKEGKFAEEDVDRLKKWHQSIEDDFAINHAEYANISDENGAGKTDPKNVRDDNYDTSWESDSTEPSSITFSFEEPVDVDRVMLQEDINEGQQVESFAIEALNDNDEWEEVYSKGTIGYKRIATLSDSVTSEKFRIRILKSRGPVHLSKIGLYKSGDSISTISDLKTLIEQYASNDEISGDKAERALSLHLRAVQRFEDTEQDEKVIKHLKNFETLLKREEASISEKAYDTLSSSVDRIIDNWN